MKKSEIQVGGEYIARVSNKFVIVKVTAIREVTKTLGKDRWGQQQTYRTSTVFDVINLTTIRALTFRSAAKFRRKAYEADKELVPESLRHERRNDPVM